MFASSKSSLRSAKRVIISAAALTTAFGIGSGTAVALPVSPDLQSLSQSVRDLKLPEISTLNSGDLAPELSEVLDSSSVKLPDSVVALINENFKFAENNKQVADKIKTAAERHRQPAVASRTEGRSHPRCQRDFRFAGGPGRAVAA